jgi:hypothetical protein
MLWTDIIDPADPHGVRRASSLTTSVEQGHARAVPALPRGGRRRRPLRGGLDRPHRRREVPRLRRGARGRQASGRQAGHARAPGTGTEHPGHGVRAAACPGRQRHRRAGARTILSNRPTSSCGRWPTSSSGCAASSSHRQGHDQPGQLQDGRRLRSRRGRCRCPLVPRGRRRRRTRSARLQTWTDAYEASTGHLRARSSPRAGSAVRWRRSTSSRPTLLGGAQRPATPTTSTRSCTPRGCRRS